MQWVIIIVGISAKYHCYGHNTVIHKRNVQNNGQITAPLSPILSDYDVEAISGIKVTNLELALRCVSEQLIGRLKEFKSSP